MNQVRLSEKHIHIILVAINDEKDVFEDVYEKVT